MGPLHSFTQLTQIRQQLHSIAEPSLNEEKTAKTILKYLKQCQPNQIYKNIAGHGIVAVFNSNKAGPTIAFRAELDALPIQEKNNISYKSLHEGFSHTCGHDGHMTILLGLGFWLQKHMQKYCGKILLIFQPAEENASGAKQIVNELKKLSLHPDYIFAIHNIPGYEKGSVLLKKNVFCAGSIGMIIKLVGKTSHAAYPNQGKNPVQAMTIIIDQLLCLCSTLNLDKENSFLTIIHAKLGEVAFGTSPGDATIMCTFRSFNDAEMKMMTTHAKTIVKKISTLHQLEFSIEWIDYFPATINDEQCIKTIETISRTTPLSVHFLKEPMRWSEDFSFFLQNITGAMIGIGSGIHHAQLHNPDYDFPDHILQPTINLYKKIIKKFCSQCHGGK
jgi:amidohydrolase